MTGLYLAATRSYLGDDAKQIFRLSQLSKRLNIPLVATNDVHYHNPERRQLQDVLTCIREKCTIQNAGYRLHQNAERHLKDQAEMKRLFLHYPDAIATNAGDRRSLSVFLRRTEICLPGRTHYRRQNTAGRNCLSRLERRAEKYGSTHSEEHHQTTSTMNCDFIERDELCSLFSHGI